jgi:hypothetical protein
VIERGLFESGAWRTRESRRRFSSAASSYTPSPVAPTFLHAQPCCPHLRRLPPCRRALALNPLLESAKAGLENLERLEKTHDADADANLDGLARPVLSTLPPSTSTGLPLLRPHLLASLLRNPLDHSARPSHERGPSRLPPLPAPSVVLPAVRHVTLGGDRQACAGVVCECSCASHHVSRQ